MNLEGPKYLHSRIFTRSKLYLNQIVTDKFEALQA
jgi:hypothetical protein